jgi:hypothetical protein
MIHLYWTAFFVVVYIGFVGLGVLCGMHAEAIANK